MKRADQAAGRIIMVTSLELCGLGGGGRRVGLLEVKRGTKSRVAGDKKSFKLQFVRQRGKHNTIPFLWRG